MVQPIMASLLGLGFPIEDANDPTSSVAFAELLGDESLEFWDHRAARG